MIGDTLRVWADKFLDFFLMFLLLGVITATLSYTLSYLVTGIPSSGAGALPLPGAGTTTPDPTSAVILGLSNGILTGIATAFFMAAGVHMAFQTHRKGAATIAQSFSEGVKRFVSVLVAGILIELMILGMLFVPLVVVLTGALAGDLLLAGIGLLALLALIPIAIYLFLSFAVYAPVIVVEGAGAIAGLQRSWAYMRGRRLSYLGSAIVIGLLTVIISLPLGLVPVAARLAGGTGAGLVTGFVASVLSTALTASLAIILAAVAGHVLMSRQPQAPA